MSGFDPVTLDECVKLRSGNTPSKAWPDFWGGDFPWVSAKDMKSYWVDSSEDRLTETGAAQASRAPAGTTLLLTRGMTLHNDIPICRLTREAAFNQDVKAVYPKPGLETDFIPYLLLGNKPKIRGIVDAAGHGTGRLNTDQLLSIKVFRPEPEDQKAIVEVCSSLDEKIELNRKQNRILEAIAQTLFKHWFVEFEFPDENGRPYKSSGSAMQPSELGEIPVGWEVKPLSELITLIGGGTPKTSVPEYWGGDIPWFSVVDAPNGSDTFVIDTEKSVTQAGIENSSARLLRVGTTIVSARGTVGRLAVVGRDMAMNQSCYGAQGRIEGSDHFTYLMLQRALGELRASAHGSVFDTITRATFENLVALRPDEEVVREFESLVAPQFQKILTNVRQSEVLAKIRDTLLPKLMSGELRVGDPEESKAVAK